ncbi:MAG TPA: phage Gp37/Gp68 family protein [Candidatus Thiothrix moscowensis]|uniref:phage Gp37/Gp68 family protein n=1 Tax=unclassified Thiothrix TaxID=2636184 RepID=UPI0025E1639E|nr:MULTISPECIES: phage Gp37/Gp68 family protein [unclassified Thiothrix]HRJ52269.1 phage Gp37/Gp68 family protein [Candidatus Thiothrix moscowensis]HRJ92584.1 phage Gp37/Gp68 family protein [Candidatus Thiothrix moscowensis]
MADTTNISWTDSTHNLWWGCTKVGQGCDNCYAAALDRRTGGNHFDAEPYKRLSDHYWRQPPKWNHKAEQVGKRHRVFCGSMCDWADKQGYDDQRDRLWNLVRATPHLDWQLLTKRASNIRKYLPADWGCGYANVWLGVTVENRRQGLRRLAILRDVPALVRFLSVEPLLEDLGSLDLSGIHWVIVGGESGVKARQMEPAWVDNIFHQCQEQSVPFFFKQWGTFGEDRQRRSVVANGCLYRGREWKGIPV